MSSSAIRTSAAPSVGDLGRRRRPGERVVLVTLRACGLLSVLTTAGILLVLSAETISFFREVNLADFAFGTKWSPLIEPKSYGVLPLIAGTLQIGVISAIVGVPLGLATAIYLSEYASPRVRSKLKPTLEVLAGIPTVVLGFFALQIVTKLVLRRLIPGIDFFNGLSAGIVVGIMIVPTVASISEDALAAVPRALRYGAYALGSSRLVVSLRVVVPAALSGVMAAVVLGISRAVGETMIVAIAAGSTPVLTASPLKSIQTLTGYIVQVSLGDTPQTSIEFKGIFAVGIVLFFMTFILNLVSQKLIRRFRQVY